MSSFPYPPTCQHLKSFYREALTGFSHVQSPYHIALSRLYPWNSFWEWGRQVNGHLKDRGRAEEPPIAQVPLDCQWAITSSG